VALEAAMSRQKTRLLLAAVSLAGLLMLGAGLVTAGRNSAEATSVYTIEIIESGFNPAICTVNRFDGQVRWLNKTDEPITVIFPDIGSPDNPPVYIFGPIEPGEASATLSFEGNQFNDDYFAFEHPEWTGTLIAPLSPSAASACSPLPPTPTPTPTLQPTATPIRPEGCDRFFAQADGCAVAPEVARDDAD
jgi:hypothetical protein